MAYEACNIEDVEVKLHWWCWLSEKAPQRMCDAGIVFRGTFRSRAMNSFHGIVPGSRTSEMTPEWRKPVQAE